MANAEMPTLVPRFPHDSVGKVEGIFLDYANVFDMINMIIPFRLEWNGSTPKIIPTRPDRLMLVGDGKGEGVWMTHRELGEIANSTHFHTREE